MGTGTKKHRKGSVKRGEGKEALMAHGGTVENMPEPSSMAHGQAVEQGMLMRRR